ncbi:MAG: glycosyltransferase family 39 protein [Anaerolineaceae bacterium]|nr:glycosyltransferase family 39 protein [Anaerolineaceae bacterium]
MELVWRSLVQFWRRHKRPFLLWTGLVGLTFGTILLGIDRLPNGDFSGQFHAFALFQSREIAAGHLPLWSPGSYGGFPFVADPQAAVFYPVRWLTVLGSLPWGYTYYVLEFEGILHLWLAGLFTYLFAYEILRRQDAALISAIVFGLGGYLTSYPLLQLAILETITWLPLVLLLLRRAMAQETAVQLRPLLASALVLGVSFTAGHPQTFLQIIYLVLAYAVYLGWRRGWSWGTMAKVGLAGGFVTVGTSAAAWLPIVSYSQASSRAVVDYNFVSGGLPLEDFLQLFLPGAISFWTPVTVGTGTLLLVLLAWHGRSQLRGTEATFGAGTAVVAAILSLGDKGFLFAILTKLLPGLALFRSQERWLAFFSFALALLAGFGVLVWQKWHAGERQTAVRQWSVVLLLGLLATGVSFILAPSLTSRDWLPILLQRLVLLLAFTLLLSRLRWPNLQLWLVALLLAGDLYLATDASLSRVQQSPQVFWPQPAWLEALHHEGNLGRIDSRMIFWSNLGEIYDLADIRGISPLKYEKLAHLEDLPLPRRWALLNVTHVLQADPEPGVALTAVTPITESIVPGEPQNAMLFRLDAPQPYAWMVYEVLSAPDDGAAFNTLANPEFDLNRQVVVTNETVESGPTPTEQPQVTVQTRRAGFTQLQVTTPTAGVLVLSEWDLPGWQVAVDGTAAKPFTANYAFQGVWLPPGTHTVTWHYRPWQVTVGLAISLLTVLGTAVFLRRPQAMKAGQRRPLILPRPALPQLHLRQISPNWSWRIYLLLLTLAAWAVRVFSAAAQELRGDEGFSYLFASLPLHQIIPELIPVGEPHSPLHYLLLHGLMAVAGPSEFVMRLPALIPGLLLIPLMAEWGRLVGGRRVGGLAALFTAVSQSLIWLAQDVRNQYAVAICFTVLASILLIRACQRQKSFWLWTGYALAAAVAAHGHYYGIFALVSHGVYVWFQPQRWPKLRAWATAGAVATLLFLPWPLVTWSQLTARHLSETLRIELATHLLNIGQELTVGAAFDLPLARWVLLVALGLLVAGWLWCYRRQRAWAWSLAIWLGGATWVIYLLRFRRSIFNDYYMSVIAPGWWLLVAIGVVALWQQRRAWLAAGGLAVLLAANLLSLSHYYGRPADYQRYVGYRDVAASVAAAEQPGDVLLLHSPDPAFDYYLRHLKLPQTRQPQAFDLSDTAIEGELAVLAATYDRIWFVPVNNNIVDPTAVVPRWLDYHLLHELDVTLRRLRLQAFHSHSGLPEVLTPLDQDLADWLTLEGYYLTVNGRPVADLIIRPGDTLAVTLVWQAHQPLPADLTVFVHLLGVDGQLVAQKDNAPLFGTRPTTSWQPGERLIDRYELTIAEDTPAQTVQLSVGMYDPITLERQAFVGGETAVPLGTWQLLEE